MGIGVFVLSIDPANFGGSTERLSGMLENLRGEHRVRLPAMELIALPEQLDIDAGTLQLLEQAAAVQPNAVF